MKKFKMFLGLLVVVFVALIIYQNRAYFFAKQALSLSLGVPDWNWTTQEFENVAYYGGCFVIGLLVLAFMWLGSKLKSMKIIKKLDKEVKTHLETIASLNIELDALRTGTHKTTDDDVIQAELNDANHKPVELQKEY